MYSSYWLWKDCGDGACHHSNPTTWRSRLENHLYGAHQEFMQWKSQRLAAQIQASGYRVCVMMQLFVCLCCVFIHWMRNRQGVYRRHSEKLHCGYPKDDNHVSCSRGSWCVWLPHTRRWFRVTTPEKWDSMTRRWNDHKQLMKLISLFLVCHHFWAMISFYE